jgi:hypothetical protein
LLLINFLSPPIAAITVPNFKKLPIKSPKAPVNPLTKLSNVVKILTPALIA